MRSKRERVKKLNLAAKYSSPSSPGGGGIEIYDPVTGRHEPPASLEPVPEAALAGDDLEARRAYQARARELKEMIGDPAETERAKVEAREELGLTFADMHQPMMDAMAKAKAALGNDFDVCGRDGVRPAPDGQLIMAYAFLRALGCDGQIAQITVDLKGAPEVSAGHKVAGGTGGQVEIESQRYPYCFDADPKSSGSTRSITPYFPFNEELNRFTLKVKNLDATKANVTWGGETNAFTREQLANGVNLAAEFSRTPFDENFQRVLEAVSAKQRFEIMMIKTLITNFRGFADEAQDDPGLGAAFRAVGERLMVHQAGLETAVRKAIAPVKHTITVTPQ